MQKPFVTVLIDTCNHERFIEQALVSVLEQDLSPQEMEIIVVDDGSTDDTGAIVRKFAPRVRYLYKPNGGQASAFNAGIPEARGEVVAFLDGDDWWAPRKARSVAEALRADSTVGIVGHGITVVHPDGRQRVEVLNQIPRFRANTTKGALAFRLRKSLLGASRMTLRSDLLRRILPVPEALTIEADEYLFTLAAALSEASILPEALTFYRLHEGNSFQLWGFDEGKLRRKQQILACLAAALDTTLRREGLAPAVVRAITEVISTEADQLRLTLDGGFPWETVETKYRLDRIMNERAWAARRIYKLATLLPALFLPPQLFYRLRSRIAQNGFYIRAKKTLLPDSPFPHVTQTWKDSA